MERKGKKGSWSVFMGFVLTAAVALTGCGGGGGGGGTTTATDTTTDSGGTGASLRVAERISVVDADRSSGSGVAGLRIGKFKVPPSTVTAAGTDWSNDEPETFVAERSAESFDIINEILCMMAQTQYDDMVNKGNYKAQVDANQCSSDNDSAESAGQSSQNQSSGSTAPDYEAWTVNSYRADSSSPHIVKVWIHEEANDYEPAKVILVKTTITEGVDTAPPYGLFTLNFKAHPVINGTVDTSTTMFKGFLKSEENTTTGKILLKFAMNGGFAGGGTKMVFSEQVVLDRAGDGATGNGTAAIFDSFSSAQGKNQKDAKFNISFNTSNFRRADAPSNTNAVCLKRPNPSDPTTYDATAWRYGLYYTNGARVIRNSGFPIKVTTGGADYHGWVGYWGLWVPDNVTINNGDPVYKMNYSASGATPVPYTVLKVGGKLKKHTQKLLTLADIKNIPLDYWDNQTMTNYRVIWTGSAFNKVAQLNQSTYMWTDIAPAVALDLSSLNFGDLNFWSQALNGQVRVKLTCTGNYPLSCSAVDGNSVVFYSEDIIYPGDTVPSNLRCYDNCPKYDATAGITTTPPNWDPNVTTVFDYTFNATTSGMVLKDGSGNSLLLASANENNQWGFMSGPLFDPTSANLSALACDWDNTKTCGWKAWSELPVFYTWETGPNQWNQLTLLTDSNGPVKFDPPLQVQYTHTQTDTGALDAKYNGSKFYLEYSGFGELHGIPGICVDMDTGLPTNCGSGGEMIRWVPEFMITEGSIVTNGSATYYAKPLEMELRMKQDTSAGACSTLTFGTSVADLPDITLWSDPAIGTEPTGSSLISAVPAVIGGVVQTGF